MKPAFPEISKIPYEGPASKNPLAFKHHDSTKVIENRTMATAGTYLFSCAVVGSFWRPSKTWQPGGPNVPASYESYGLT